MDIREKLVGLLTGCGICLHCFPSGFYEELEKRRIADYLIANGVTVQEWIPVTERLPAIREKVLVYGSHGGIYTAYLVQGKPFPEWHKVGGKNSYCNPTHWMHRPKPPKRKRS